MEQEFIVGCSPITSTLYAGTVSKKGLWSKNRKDVTETAPLAVAQMLLQTDEHMEFTYNGEQYVLKVEKKF